MEPRITQKQIAAAAGVHSTTVSLVFRNHPSIPEATRKRIRKLAAEMGYSPDPMLSSLAAYRSSQRPQAYHGMLAWVTNSRDGFDWRASPHFSQYYRAISDRAKQHGYGIDEFDIHTYRKNPRQLASILRARGIQGLLLCPQPKAHTAIELPWETFAVVTFGYTLQAPRFHSVAPTFLRSMLRTLAEVRRRRYNRVGLVLNPDEDDRFGSNVLAGYLADEYRQNGKLRIPPLLKNYWEKPQLLADWITSQKPDCIVCQDWRVWGLLKHLGIRVPGVLGLACAGFPPGITGLTGIVEDSWHIGVAATDMIAAMIHRGERGVPAKAQQVLVDGDWTEGRTLVSLPRQQKGGFKTALL